MDLNNWRILGTMDQGSPFGKTKKWKRTCWIWIMMSDFSGTENKCREMWTLRPRSNSYRTGLIFAVVHL